MKSTVDFNIVMVCDFRMYGGVSAALVTEIRTFSDAGFKIGLLQINSPFMDRANPTNSDIRHCANLDILLCVDSGLAKWLNPSQRINCDLLAVHEPNFIARADLPRQNIRSRNRIIIAHYVPLGSTGRLNYDPWRSNAMAQKYFGGEFIWAPISPVCREQFHKIFFDLPLLADDWHNIIRVKDWGAPRSSAKFRNCVIGRHSRPSYDKWPATRKELQQCHPPDPDFEVRILGADSYLRKLVGLVPENWRLFAYNEIPPKEFLQTIDFFVYFHHPLILESFGRAPAEAAAAGCVLILQPQDVAAIVRTYRSDPGAYGRQSQSGYDIVSKLYRPESLLQLARLTLDKPRIAKRRKSSFYSHAKNSSMRSVLRTKLRVRERGSNSKRLVKEILRLAARQRPGGIHE